LRGPRGSGGILKFIALLWAGSAAAHVDHALDPCLDPAQRSCLRCALECWLIRCAQPRQHAAVTFQNQTDSQPLKLPAEWNLSQQAFINAK
jgi:hypothetical protein